MGRLTGRPSYSRRGGRSRPLTGTALGRKYRTGIAAESTLRAGPMPAPVVSKEPDPVLMAEAEAFLEEYSDAFTKLANTPTRPPAIPWFLRPIVALSYLATPVALWQLLTNAKSRPN